VAWPLLVFITLIAIPLIGAKAAAVIIGVGVPALIVGELVERRNRKRRAAPVRPPVTRGPQPGWQPNARPAPVQPRGRPAGGQAAPTWTPHP